METRRAYTVYQSRFDRMDKVVYMSEKLPSLRKLDSLAKKHGNISLVRDTVDHRGIVVDQEIIRSF